MQSCRTCIAAIRQRLRQSDVSVLVMILPMMRPDQGVFSGKGHVPMIEINTRRDALGHLHRHKKRALRLGPTVEGRIHT